MKWLSDLVGLAGAGCLLYGLYAWWPPLAWMAAGLMLLMVWAMWELHTMVVAGRTIAEMARTTKH